MENALDIPVLTLSGEVRKRKDDAGTRRHGDVQAVCRSLYMALSITCIPPRRVAASPCRRVAVSRVAFAPRVVSYCATSSTALRNRSTVRSRPRITTMSNRPGPTDCPLRDACQLFPQEERRLTLPLSIPGIPVPAMVRFRTGCLRNTYQNGPNE